MAKSVKAKASENISIENINNHVKSGSGMAWRQASRCASQIENHATRCRTHLCAMRAPPRARRMA